MNGHNKFDFRIVQTDAEAMTANLDFDGYGITRHKYQSLFKKGCTHYRAQTDILTKDGYSLRVFAIGFTQYAPHQRTHNCYAQSGQVHRMRSAMVSAIKNSLKNVTIKEVMAKLGNHVIDTDMLKAASLIHISRDVIVQRIKVLEAPKGLEASKKLYEGAPMDFGKKAEGTK